MASVSATPNKSSGASTPTLSVPSAAMDKTPDEGSRLRTFLSILKKYEYHILEQKVLEHGEIGTISDGAGNDCNNQANFWGLRFIGVADIANVRFSLPAQLMEPVPNLGTC